MWLQIPPEALQLAEDVRLQFVSYANDKFFRGSYPLGMPVISASVSNVKVRNLSERVSYHIPTPPDLKGYDPQQAACVFWDEEGKSRFQFRIVRNLNKVHVEFVNYL